MAIIGYVLGKFIGWTIQAHHLGIIEYNTMLALIAACIAPVVAAGYFLLKKEKTIEKWIKNEKG